MMAREFGILPTQLLKLDLFEFQLNVAIYQFGMTALAAQTTQG